MGRGGNKYVMVSQSKHKGKFSKEGGTNMSHCHTLGEGLQVWLFAQWKAAGGDGVLKHGGFTHVN